MPILNPIVAAALSFGLANTSSAQWNESWIELRISQLEEADDFHAVRGAYRNLFDEVGGDLTNLKQSPIDSIAIQSAWESVMRSNGAEQQPKALGPTRESIDHFIGFIEGRARATPPDWWIKGLQDCKFIAANGHDPIDHQNGVAPGPLDTDPYRDTGLPGVRSPVGTTVKQNGNSYVFQADTESMPIPEELFDRCESGNLCDNVSGTFSLKTCVLAIHGGYGYSHVVASVNRMSGETQWKSMALGCNGGGTSGPGMKACVHIAIQDDRVVVFGMSDLGFWMQGFHPEDGATLFRFSTGF